jgi:hypothetical protein
MNTKILKELDTIGEIILIASYNISCLEYMSDDPENKKKETTHRFIFMRVALNSIWSISILELNKLLSSSQKDKFRLTSIINRLINNYKNIEWKREKSIEELQELNQRLDKYKDKIEIIKTLRDKQIAHKDFLKSPLYLTLKDLKPLLELCQVVYNNLSLALTDGTTYWGLSESEKIQPVVLSLIKYQRIKELAFQNLANLNDSISTGEIINIIRSNS